jgi:hypothetical protein
MISITSANNLRANKNNKNPRKMKEKTYEFFIIYTLISRLRQITFPKTGRNRNCTRKTYYVQHKATGKILFISGIYKEIKR